MPIHIFEKQHPGILLLSESPPTLSKKQYNIKEITKPKKGSKTSAAISLKLIYVTVDLTFHVDFIVAF